MVYIRSKSVGRDRYLYLVRSVWDPKRSTSRQEIIKYLGKASGVRPGDIPADYRDDPKIREFLAANAGGGAAENRRAVARLQDEGFAALVRGDLGQAVRIYEYAAKDGMAGFYEKILIPVMHRIGVLWDEGGLGIADEHVASNTAAELVGVINERNARQGGRRGAKVLICAPNGEEHSLGCSMLQSLLNSKGYRVFNLSPSAPSEAIVHFVRESKPDIVLISITIGDNVRTGQRLVRKILRERRIPVLVGGQAVEQDGTGFDCDVVVGQRLENILKAISCRLR